MAYLFPPMDDEPPADYLAFVADRLEPLHREAWRLCGGDRSAGSLAMDVLTDLAGHWRRLVWEGRLRRRDVRGDYLTHRLAKRTAQWREDQIYPVEVTVVPPPKTYARPAPTTVAQQLAPLLPTTVRDEAGVVAEAEIAWVHAYRRHIWHRYARICGGGILLVGGMIQVMSQASGAG
ncbi:hypothetical protein AB0J80_16520 [Actinoplanes sp. NPDC049548]|uniref:hypothetical protein n=1 Tax=Actinoplanes sp. NPDC049548 TaxID=3155152 RepID=UPI00343C05CC